MSGGITARAKMIGQFEELIEHFSAQSGEKSLTWRQTKRYRLENGDTTLQN